jgi:hypothetical protein
VTGRLLFCPPRTRYIAQRMTACHPKQQKQMTIETKRFQNPSHPTPIYPPSRSRHQNKNRCCAAGRGHGGTTGAAARDRLTLMQVRRCIRPRPSSALSQSGSSAPEGACYERRSRHCHSKWRAYEPQTGALWPTLAGPFAVVRRWVSSVSARLRRWEMEGLSSRGAHGQHTRTQATR